MPSYSKVLPRVYQIVLEIDNRFVIEMAQKGIDPAIIKRNTRIVKDNQIHMANLAIIGGHSVNGVAKLHTELLKEDTLHDFYTLYPRKNSITKQMVSCNVVGHKSATPRLSYAIDQTIGTQWRKDIHELRKLNDFVDDSAVLNSFYQVKQDAKARLAAFIKESTGVEIINRSYL